MQRLISVLISLSASIIFSGEGIGGEPLWSLLQPSIAYAAENNDGPEEEDAFYDVIIVGGGIAGLTASFYLQDLNILVLEKKDYPGGRAFSGFWGGFSYAKGTEYLGKPEGPLKEMIDALGLLVREIPEPADILYRENTYYYGETGKAKWLAQKTSLEEFNRFGRIVTKSYQAYDELPEFDPSGTLAHLDTITARQWFVQQGFAPAYQELYNVTFKGLFGATIDEISAISALPEIAFDFEDFEAFDEDDLINTYRPGHGSSGMFSFDNGIAEIPLALGKMLGKRLIRGATVEKISLVEGDYAVECRRKDGRLERYYGASVIVATPADITKTIGKGLLTKRQQELLAKVVYAPYVTVALFSEKPIFNKGFDLALPNGTGVTDIYDATWVERFYNKTTGNDNHWITTVYIAPESYRDRTLLQLSDQQIAELAYKALDQIFTDPSGFVKGEEVIRFKRGYPVMLPGMYQAMSELHRISDNGVFLAGDYLVYPTFEAAAESGRLAAERVRKWFGD